MYLVDFQLRELIEKADLVDPPNYELVNPASIDLTLGTDFVNLSPGGVSYKLPGDAMEWDWRIAQPSERFQAERVFIHPGISLLASTAERVRIPDSAHTFVWGERFIEDGWDKLDEFQETISGCVGELRLKSSAARNGLDHALAGWIDPGFEGNLTLELHAHRPFELVAGKAYVQLVVATTLAPPQKSYQQTGRYVGAEAVGAVRARPE